MDGGHLRLSCKTVEWAERPEELRQARVANAQPGQRAPDVFHLPLVGPGLAD